MDALAVDIDNELLGDIPNDLHRLSLGDQGYLVHRADYQVPEFGGLDASVRRMVIYESAARCQR